LSKPRIESYLFWGPTEGRHPAQRHEAEGRETRAYAFYVYIDASSYEHPLPYQGRRRSSFGWVLLEAGGMSVSCK